MSVSVSRTTSAFLASGVDSITWGSSWGWYCPGSSDGCTDPLSMDWLAGGVLGVRGDLRLEGGKEEDGRWGGGEGQRAVQDGVDLGGRGSRQIGGKEFGRK